MRRFWLLLAVGVGFGLGQLDTGRRKPTAPPPPVTFEGEITVRRSFGVVEHYRPHSVLVDQHQAFIDHAHVTNEPVTVFSFDSGRVQVAATAVTP